jgi:hypothetical protein
MAAFSASTPVTQQEDCGNVETEIPHVPNDLTLNQHHRALALC